MPTLTIISSLSCCLRVLTLEVRTDGYTLQAELDYLYRHVPWMSYCFAAAKMSKLVAKLVEIVLKRNEVDVVKGFLSQAAFIKHQFQGYIWPTGLTSDMSASESTIFLGQYPEGPY